MQPIPRAARIRALHQRQEQLERHLERCRAAVDARPAPNPSVGRELNDTSSSLAKVRGELARLASR
ncbi:MAG: hypothetical protein ACRDLN_09450 [Solirubrobacteraceae bacterium]